MKSIDPIEFEKAYASAMEAYMKDLKNPKPKSANHITETEKKRRKLLTDRETCCAAVLALMSDGRERTLGDMQAFIQSKFPNLAGVNIRGMMSDSAFKAKFAFEVVKNTSLYRLAAQ